jgi:hypothetical protein
MSPLAMSYGRCAVCHGAGILPPGSVCPCVTRRMVRERRWLDSMERLWLDAMAHPEWFPPRPVPVSSLMRWERYE